MRLIRPRCTVAEPATLLLLVACFCLTPHKGAAAGMRADRPVPILMYHVISAPPPGVAYSELFVRPDDFVGQMQWLVEHDYAAVTLHQVYDSWLSGSPLPARPVVISFDDGYMSDQTQALPVLRWLHWPGVLNLKVNALHSRYALPLWRARALVHAGWEIDSHTITHRDLTKLDAAQLWTEVHGSRVSLQHALHVPVDFFCYPGGRFDARVIAAVRRAGYLGATTTTYGLARPQDMYSLARIRIDGSDGVVGFATKLEGLAP